MKVTYKQETPSPPPGTTVIELSDEEAARLVALMGCNLTIPHALGFKWSHDAVHRFMTEMHEKLCGVLPRRLGHGPAFPERSDA